MTLEELFSAARARKIPVIREDSGKLLFDYVKQNRPARILEIGTAVGCSALLMLKANPSAKIVTIELDESRFDEAHHNFAAFGVLNNVRQILDDCTVAVRYLEGKYDLIFLDGPKGQYPDMLPYLIPLLADGGAIFADDVSFFGAVNGNNIPPHKNRTIIMELRRFRNMLEQNPDFELKFYDTTDGTLIAVKR